MERGDVGRQGREDSSKESIRAIGGRVMGIWS